MFFKKACNGLKLKKKALISRTRNNCFCDNRKNIMMSLPLIVIQGVYLDYFVNFQHESYVALKVNILRRGKTTEFQKLMFREGCFSIMNI